MSRLPLTALRVFEAAARHESFLQAAEELAITPGAVSRQIKALEAELAVRLFERFNRAVRLTETGRRLATGVRQGLSLMEEAVADLWATGVSPDGHPTSFLRRRRESARRQHDGAQDPFESREPSRRRRLGKGPRMPNARCGRNPRRRSFYGDTRRV